MEWCSPLRHDSLEQILEIDLGRVQPQGLDAGRRQFLFRVTPLAIRFLLREGTDIKYGAWDLKRAIEKHVVVRLHNLLATEQIHFGDFLVIDWDEEDQAIVFRRQDQCATIPVPPRCRLRTTAF